MVSKSMMNRLFDAILVLTFVAIPYCIPSRLSAQESEIQLLPPISGSDDGSISTEVTSEELLGEELLTEAPTDFWTPWSTTMGWFNSPIWDFGMELGVNGSEGNSQAFSMMASGSFKRETEASTVEVKINYGKTQADGVETQHYALLDGRWDWNISPIWFLYTKTILEYDEFKFYDIRMTNSGGLGYHFIKNDRITLTSRFGAGVSREFGGLNNEWIPEANVGADAEHALTKRQKLNLTVDYYPAWKEFSDFHIIADANWEVLLDEATNLSLKLGAIDRYDSTPDGALANDIDYYVTLLWKL